MSGIAFLQNRSLRRFLPAILLLLVWSVLTWRGWISDLILVSPWKLVGAAFKPETRTDLLLGLAASSRRFLEGGGIGIGLGLVLGIGLGVSRTVDRIVGPSFHAFRQVAVFAWIPLFTAWFGNGDASKVVFIALATFAPVVMGSFEGVRNVPKSYLEVGRVLCLSRFQLLRKIVLPSAAPAIFTGLQLALIFAWFAAIGAEYLIGGIARGLGSFVMNERSYLRTDGVLLGVLVISLVGIGVNRLLFFASRSLFRWKSAA